MANIMAFISVQMLRICQVGGEVLIPSTLSGRWSQLSQPYVATKYEGLCLGQLGVFWQDTLPSSLTSSATLHGSRTLFLQIHRWRAFLTPLHPTDSWHLCYEPQSQSFLRSRLGLEFQMRSLMTPGVGMALVSLIASLLIPNSWISVYNIENMNGGLKKWSSHRKLFRFYQLRYFS